MTRSVGFLLLALLLFPLPALAQTFTPRPGSDGVRADPNTPRPIDALESVWIEELTWMEVRDAIHSGKTTAIIPTGGVEQNGPYLSTGKHNVILRATAEAVARKLGNALVAPIVPFVPEGEIDLPPGGMDYPGTIGVTDDTFKRLLTDIGLSLRANGFSNIVLIGDSGGNQTPMSEVATALSARWTDGKTDIYFIPEYYNWPERQEWLKSRGIHEVIQPGGEGLHDEYSATSIMMLVDPTTVRIDQRLRAGEFSIHGVYLAPTERTIAIGRELVDWIADETTTAILRAFNSRAETR